MFVGDCCINSSFFLSISLFSIAPAMFANCPNLWRSEGKDTCFHSPRGLVNGSYLFDTAAIVNFDLSGPCEFHQQAHTATLYKVHTDGSQSRVIFFCQYSSGSNGDKELCRDVGRVQVKYNIERQVDRDAFNFGLQLVNVQPSDLGLYQYHATFLTPGPYLRRIVKHFKFISGEYNAFCFVSFERHDRGE